MSSHRRHPACFETLKEEIRSFDTNNGFRNTFDVYHMECPGGTGRCELFRLLSLRNCMLNLCSFKSAYEKITGRSHPRGELLFYVTEDCTCFVADYRWKGMHYHVYLPFSYVLSPPKSLELVEEHGCPVCYEEIAPEVVKCPRCLTTVCMPCWNKMDRCCTCRYDPNETFTDNLVSSACTRPAENEGFDLFLCSRREMFVSFGVKDEDDLTKLTKILAYRRWNLYYHGEQWISPHPCLGGVPIISLNVKETFRMLTSPEENVVSPDVVEPSSRRENERENDETGLEEDTDDYYTETETSSSTLERSSNASYPRA